MMILRSAPYFPVHNVETSAAHYEQVLGFRTEYSAGSPVQFAILTRDQQSVMLRLVGSDQKLVPNEAQGGTWDVFYWVRDAKSLHAELAGRGATIVYGPIVQDAYHMLEFAVRDRDGYVLGFGESIGDSR